MAKSIELAQSSDMRCLTQDEMLAVAGGLNPQPLPPRWSMLFNFRLFLFRPQFYFRF